MERILCIKVAARGDLVLAAPAFRALRESRPGAQVDLLVGETCADVAAHLPYFDHVRPIDDRELFVGGVIGRVRATARMFAMLRGDDEGRPYSEVLIFHRDWRYGLLAWAARIPVRRGFEAGAASRFLTHAYRPADGEHHALQYAGMAGVGLAGGDPVWEFAPGEREAALEVAASLGLSRGKRPIAVLGFGGGNNVKTQTRLKSWPAESYVELAARLESSGYDVVWVGDRADAAMLPGRAPGANLAGRLTVAQTAAVLSAADLVVSNDTLTLHLADALGVRAVGIFGPTDPHLYGPRRAGSSSVWKGAELECSPCHRAEGFPECRFDHRCMTGIAVDDVMVTLERGASRTAGTSSEAAIAGGRGTSRARGTAT